MPIKLLVRVQAVSGLFYQKELEFAVRPVPGDTISVGNQIHLTVQCLAYINKPGGQTTRAFVEAKNSALGNISDDALLAAFFSPAK